MDQFTAIVLKNYYPQRLQLLLLAADVGCLTVNLRHERDAHKLATGMIIAAQVRQPVRLGQRVSLAQLEVLQMPSGELASLQFVHQILELCRYTLLPGPAQPDIFMAVHYLLTHSNQLTESQRVLLLCKLLALLDCYPAAFMVTQHPLWQILQTPIDRLAYQKIDLSLETEVLAWLRLSILAHPHVAHFKAWQFSGEGAANDKINAEYSHSDYN